MTLPQYLERLEKLLGDASPGPWNAILGEDSESFEAFLIEPNIATLHFLKEPNDQPTEANAKLIAESPTALKTLIEVCRVQSEALEYYKTYIPVHRIITPESAMYEQAFGMGRIAAEAQARVLEILKGEK